MYQRPAGTLLQKIMVKRDNSMDFGNGEVQFVGDERHRILRDECQRLLHGVQHGQKRAGQFFETRACLKYRRAFSLTQRGWALDLDRDDSPRSLLTHESLGKFIDI